MLSLLILVGVSVLALGVGLIQGLRTRSESGAEAAGVPTLGSETRTGDRDGATGGEGGLAQPRSVTVPIVLQPGWSVPVTDGGVSDERSTVGSITSAEAADAGALDGLEPGQATVGAVQKVAPGATMAIVHGSAPRRLAYRSGADDRWGEWQSVAIVDDEGPDGLPGDEGHGGERLSAGPLWLGSESTDIEFAVTGGDASSFDVTFLGSGAVDGDVAGQVDGKLGGAVEPEPSPAGATIGAWASAAAAPPIIPREQWASGEWDYRKEACDEGPSVADHLQAVVIHHTATTNSYAEEDVDDLLRAIYYSHVVVNGWCDIGYNFVVDRFGRIWEARTGSIEQAIVGGHARGFNTSTVGVALLGQHQPGARPASAAPSAAAQAAVESLARWKLEAQGVDPAGKTWLRNRSDRTPLRLAGLTWHYVPTVLAHRDLGVTSCPGSHSMGLVRDLPARLAADRDLALPYRFVDWRAHSHGPGFVVADAVGGLRPAGAATPWPQAPAGVPGGTSVIAVGGNLAGGYLLAGSGDIVGFGSAPAFAERPAGAATPVDIVVRSDGASGWVLDDTGVLHGFGGPADVVPGAAISGPVAAAVGDDGAGYVVAADGSLRPTGGAPAQTLDSGPASGATAVDLDLRPAGGGWVLDSRGRLHGFGGALSDIVEPPSAVRAVAAADTGSGGWVLDADGQLWPFGGARLVFPVSTNASAGDAVDLADVGSVYSPAFVTGDDARFVTSAYDLFLGRESSIVETELDVTDLEQGGRRLDLTSGLARSEHWSGGTVDEMYRLALRREADPDGRSYWLSQIANGLQLQDLGTYFYGSSEYANTAGSSRAYVTGLYNVLLGRAPDDEGLDYWVGVLESGRGGPPDVANGFYASVESRRDRADRLHRQILGRPPDAEDRNFWADRLLVVGDAGVAAELAASSDYYRLVVDGPEP